MNQDELEKTLTPANKEFYRMLKMFVECGNCIVDDTLKMQPINSVELTEGANGTAGGILFKTGKQ